MIYFSWLRLLGGRYLNYAADYEEEKWNKLSYM